MAIVHILDRKTDTILGTLNTSKAEYWSPLRRDSLENQNTFDFIANASVEKSSLLEKRNRLLIKDEDGFFREYIITYAEQYKRGEKIVRSNASFVDLTKAKIIEPQVLQGATSATATDTALFGTEWQPGVIDYTFIHTINIEKYTNPLALLKLIASTFGLEIRYRVEVSGNKIIGRYVDMVKQIAGFEGKETKFGKDLIGVRRKEDSNPIVTALLGLGPEKEDGTFLTALVEDVDALQRWGREGQHLIEIYEPQSSNQDMTLEELTTLTTNELKKRIDSIVSYECEAVSLEHIFGRSNEKIRVGQTCRIKDDGYKPPLYLEARIQEVEVDQATNQIKSFKIGNFIEYKKADLEAQISALKQIINEKISKMILSTVASSAGNIFKNGVGSTVLTAKVFIAGQETDVDGSRYLYKWFKYDKEGALVTGFIQTSKSITVTSVEITEKATFVVEISTDKVISAAQTTITNVEDGKSLYTWVKYADDASGTGISDDPTGKGFIGFSYNKESPIESSIATDYVWNAIEGSQGVPGTSYYTWLKYATTPTSGMSDSPTGKLYMGLAMNKATSTESTNYADYTWSLIKGDQGDPGIPGVEGPPGPAGETLYTWIKYADNVSGSGMADLPTGKTYVGLAYNKTTSVESAVPSDYKWSLIKGDQGTVGPPGDDGQTLYTWIKYATTPTTGMSDDPAGKVYMGIAYNKTVQTESLTYADYLWSLIKGPQGDQGIEGPPGPDGLTSYTHIAYATNSSGTTGFSVSDPVNKTYIGMYTDFTALDSTDPTKYKWSLIKGADGSQGIPGPPGGDGQTPYLHIAWATNSTGTTGFSTTVSTEKTYIGTYTDFVSADSTNPALYAWTLIKGDTGPPGPATYTWIKYADNASGGGMVETPAGKLYMGLAFNKTSATESSTATDYSWSLIKGTDGIPGEDGTDGTTTYTWVKYADEIDGTGMSDSPTNKRYLGLAYNKTTATESSVATDYSWSALYDNISVGGVNLLPDSYLQRFTAYTNTNMTRTDGDTTKIVRATWNGVSTLFGLYPASADRTIPYTFQEDYTLSFEVRGLVTSLDYMYMMRASGEGSNVSIAAQDVTLSTTAWTKVEFHKNSNFSTETGYFLIGSRDVAAGNWFEIQKVKIEKGNIATDWTPSISEPNTYTWIMYGNDKLGAGITSSPAGKLWRGRAFNKTYPTPSTTPGDYVWEFITDGWVKTGTVNIDGGMIEADSIAAINANLGTVTAGELQGVIVKLGQVGANGDLQVWADINNDGSPDVVGQINTNGAFFPYLKSDSFVGNVVNKYMGANLTLYFDSYNGDDAADGASWTTPKKNLQAYIDALPRYLNGKSITLRYRGDMPAGLTIEGFHNGDLLISADTIPETRRPYVYGFIRFKHCTGGKFLAQGMDVVYDSAINGSTVMCDSNNCDYVQFYDVKCYGRNAAAHAFSFDSCNFNLGECHVYNITDRALNTLKMCRGYLSNCHGVAPIAILASEGSIITGVGTRWSGSLVRWTNAIIGTVSTGNTAWQLDPWTVDTAEGTPPTPPAPTSKTLFVSASTGDNHSSQGFWTNDEVKQGDYGYGNRIGIWYANFSAIKGKNIISATMTVHRETGVGNNAARPLRLISARATSRADRSTTINTANAKSISIAAGQTITVDITTLLEANIAAGLDNNIACYTTTGSVDYMSLGLTPSFAIEYI